MSAAKSLSANLRTLLLRLLATSMTLPATGALAQDLDQWLRVPFRGTITTTRTVAGVQKLGELSTTMDEKATMFARITRCVEILNDNGEFEGWYPEGSISAEYSISTEAPMPGDPPGSLTTSGAGRVSETYSSGSDGRSWVDLEVNPGLGLYRLSLPEAHVGGILTETLVISGQEMKGTSAKTWRTGGELENGYLIPGELSYDPDAGSIFGSQTFDASTANDDQLRGQTVRMTSDLAPGFWVPVIFTATWDLHLVDPEGRLVLIPDSNYEKWIPRERGHESMIGLVGVTARILEPENAEGIIEFKLEDVSREPGVCLNRPLRDAEKSPDLDIALELCDDLKIAEDWLSAKTFVPANESTIWIRPRDFGAYGRVSARATIVTGAGEKELRAVYEVLGTDYVPLPQDEDNNRVADEWQRIHQVEGSGENDNDDQPAGASTGDGISLYEEYRGCFVQGSHERLDPTTKDFFVHDPDGLVLDSHVATAAHPLKLHYVLEDEMVVDNESDALFRVINPNYDHFHVVDQHGIIVKQDTGGNGQWGGCPLPCDNPGTTQPYVSIFVDTIRTKITEAYELYKDEIVEKLGHTPDQSWLENHIRMATRMTTTHEVGHSIGLDHHLKTLPPKASQKQVSPSSGSWTCVMRYLMDAANPNLDEPYHLPVQYQDDLKLIFMINADWPDDYCDFKNDCLSQIQISDAGQ